jgi:hypothetical protein
MVRRAIPDAWTFAEPAAILTARASAAAAALARLAPGVEAVAAGVLPRLTAAVDRGSAAARPLFAANRDLMAGASGIEALWQVATALREHRGDGHVAVLAESGLDGCEVHVLFAATENVPAQLIRDARGWSDDEWGAAVERLRARGLVGPEGEPTEAGHDLRRRIERRTDELAAGPFEELDDDGVTDLTAQLRRVARPIATSGDIPFPNPVGLPRPPSAA